MAKVAKSQGNAKEFRSAWRVHDGCAGHSGIGNRTRSVIGLFLHEDIRRSTIPVDVRRPRCVDSVKDHASIVRRGLLIAAVCRAMTNVAEYYVCRSSSLAATKLLCILS